ncbi:hypothetical protein A3B51_02535 [Candidatus Curtissbacteria bacterium RIFCSPLOWO2_01_FULL_41_18]|uniref:Uncharacterized protein n=2 Tax=Candidatus Curtissiibacteriota TaxID=1752717 RepID=A0A1F5FZ44_9BACT|nr:MAG: hypothetical protein A2696_00880 [Candidatus Curtissbacteria bacterium RIFCSPHIGHO2_01_FULL_41_13]OGE05271.1 MAG: hypothetical protein A3B51_02535 [Candidatus Curtissbacteria bacterium RIFCSPLOWO2_01_FULL_41_18]
MFLLVKEAEGTGSDSRPVTPDRDSPDDVERRITGMNAEDGPVSARPPTIGESPQRSRDKLSAKEICKRGYPGPDSHMGD